MPGKMFPTLITTNRKGERRDSSCQHRQQIPLAQLLNNIKLNKQHLRQHSCIQVERGKKVTWELTVSFEK